MVKLAFAVMASIIAALVAGAYFHLNPTIPIFIILGLGIYGVGRIGGPALPGPIGIGSSHGIYLERGDFVRPDPDSHSGPHFRDGVDTNARDEDEQLGFKVRR